MLWDARMHPTPHWQSVRGGDVPTRDREEQDALREFDPPDVWSNAVNRATWVARAQEAPRRAGRSTTSRHRQTENFAGRNRRRAAAR